MNILKMEKKKQVLNALVEGCSTRSISRMSDIDRGTVLRVLVEAGNKCQIIMDSQVKDFHSKFIEVDEIWTFCKKKEKHLTEDEKTTELFGDQYVFVAMDSQSKLIPTYQVGKRNMENTLKFIFNLKDKLQNNGRIQLTSDGWKSYIDAIEMVFGADIDFAQLVKLYSGGDSETTRYSPSKIKGVLSKIFTGKPNPKNICTSYIERQNLTMRMQMRRFTRLTNAFSKKLENLKAALALHFCHYNFCRIHGTLRVTPAMQAGISDHIWTWEEVLAY
tara:strand:- start:312 stop:1136 length:825 start_codon:yes stop_codon:yes gene_type:complete